jgi:hypothetical protein
MDTTNNHTKLETALKKKAYLSFHNDGIIDMLMGWDLAVIGLSLFLHKMSPLTTIIALAPLFLYTPLKYKITLPRLGHAQFRTHRTLSVWLAGIVGGFFLLAAIIFGFFINSPSGFIGPIALALIGIAFSMALVSGFNRILAYAILIPLYFIAGFGLRILSPVMIIATGVIVMVLGIWMLVKFLRTYPVQAEEDNLGK